MKSAIGSLIVLSAVGICFLPGGSNVLENPSFETGDASGWSEPQEILGSVGAPGAGAQDGSFAIQLTQPGGGGVPEIRQIMPASPGEIWEMRGFHVDREHAAKRIRVLVCSKSFSKIRAVLICWLRISKSGARTLTSLELSPLHFWTSNQATDTWVESVAKGTAPAGYGSRCFACLERRLWWGRKPALV